jgi:hypothetical protein
LIFLSAQEFKAPKVTQELLVSQVRQAHKGRKANQALLVPLAQDQ